MSDVPFDPNRRDLLTLFRKNRAAPAETAVAETAVETQASPAKNVSRRNVVILGGFATLALALGLPKLAKAAEAALTPNAAPPAGAPAQAPATPPPAVGTIIATKLLRVLPHVNARIGDDQAEGVYSGKVQGPNGPADFEATGLQGSAYVRWHVRIPSLKTEYFVTPNGEVRPVAGATAPGPVGTALTQALEKTLLDDLKKTPFLAPGSVAALPAFNQKAPTGDTIERIIRGQGTLELQGVGNLSLRVQYTPSDDPAKGQYLIYGTIFDKDNKPSGGLKPFKINSAEIGQYMAGKSTPQKEAQDKAVAALREQLAAKGLPVPPAPTAAPAKSLPLAFTDKDGQPLALIAHEQTKVVTSFASIHGFMVKAGAPALEAPQNLKNPGLATTPAPAEKGTVAPGTTTKAPAASSVRPAPSGGGRAADELGL